MKTHIPTLTLLLLLTGTFPLTAQNELKPAKNVVTLREVFSKSGYPTGNQRYGSGFWGGVDLNGDSIGDFAIHQASTNQWFFYAGGPKPDTAAMWSFDSAGGGTLLFGDFHGDGTQSVIVNHSRIDKINGISYIYVIPSAYKIIDGRIAELPYDTNEVRGYRALLAAEIDGKPGLELIIAHKFHGSQEPGRVEIYAGGPDFQIHTPDYIIVDTGHGESAEFSWYLWINDFDGDGFTDIATGGGYPGVGDMLRFRWGDANSPQSWTERDFDRDIRLEHGKVGINTMSDLAIFDVNGDGVADLGSFEYEDLQGNRIYLSGEGKDFRTRSFSIEDADIYYPNGHLLTFSAGFINDSTRRHEMMLLRNGSDIWGVSGSSTGPDFDYDARYSQGQLIPPFGPDSRGIRDVTGDGWDDFLGGDDAVANGAGTGLVLAGGPYIPFDDPTVSVREEPVAGIARGLFLWPNPVVNELHIAWRGDLRQMPDRFEIYNEAGELVVDANASESFGEIVWDCTDVPPGLFILHCYDANDQLLTTLEVIKR